MNTKLIEQISDKAITQAIQDEFQTDDLVVSKKIGVQTRRGIVRLSGSAPTLQAKERALALTETIRASSGFVK